MRVVKSVLVALLVAGLVMPATATAATKLRTKIRFAPTPYREWSLETTSVPVPYAKGQLLYYKPTTRRWYPYAYKTVWISSGSSYVIPSLAPTRKTNKGGYFYFPMPRPVEYTAYFPGNASTWRSWGMHRRNDWVHTDTPHTVTTSSVDASHTRIDIQTDYLYNPYVWDRVKVSLGVYGLKPCGRSLEVYTSSFDVLDKPLSGIGHARWSFDVPNSILASMPVSGSLRVSYPGSTLFADYNQHRYVEINRSEPPSGSPVPGCWSLDSTEP